VAIGALTSMGLAAPDGKGTWHLTPAGQAAEIVIAPRVRKRGRGVASGIATSAARLLAALDHPRRGAELPWLLGLTRQRVHQLVVDLAARGHLRLADPNRATYVIARKDDPTLLLRPVEVQVLSALRQAAAVTLSQVANVVTMPHEQIASIMEFLRNEGFAQHAGSGPHGDLYRLTPAGAAHWQRSAAARPACTRRPTPRPPRVHDVLSHLAAEGPTRTRDIGRKLGLRNPHLNNLIHNLKHRGAVRSQFATRGAPYELTARGRGMLAARLRSAGDGTDAPAIAH
jgi:DNA-binding IclR family transcriptional regulator